MRIGVISDTHGLLRPEALDAMAGVDHVLHAGDVGRGDILGPLGRIAPVTAIRGNVDRDGPASELPPHVTLTLGGSSIHMVHDAADLDADPAAAGWSAVIVGHSHKPSLRREDGVLHLNPGSAGPRRFSLPVTLAILRIAKGEAVAEIVPLL